MPISLMPIEKNFQSWTAIHATNVHWRVLLRRNVSPNETKPASASDNYQYVISDCRRIFDSGCLMSSIRATDVNTQDVVGPGDEGKARIQIIACDSMAINAGTDDRSQATVH
jgi:hypothetical protein